MEHYGAFRAEVHAGTFDQKMKREKTTIWMALRDGDCKGVAATPAALWRTVTTGGWYRPSQEKRWTFVFRARSLPVASGQAHDWSAEGGRGGIKIHWTCPLCQQLHFSDKDADEPNPTIWLCEAGGMRPVVIHWKTTKTGRTRKSRIRLRRP